MGKKNSSLFSVIILHYQQPEFWEKAVLSVLQQTYPEIQLIFIDDGSADFDKEEVKAYINKNKKENLKAFVVLVNEINIGTVKSINRAFEYVDGEYTKIFAADDALYNETVIETFVKNFGKKNITALYGRSLKCNRLLEPIGEDYIDITVAEQFNKLSWKEQFAELVKKCCFPMGAMAFKTRKLRKYMPLNTQYRLIEDWPLFLNMSRHHERFIFVDFPVLYYRAGGVSDATHNCRDHRIQCDCDHLKIHDNEIWPYVRYLRKKDLLELYERYNMYRHFMVDAVKRTTLIKRQKLVLYDFRIAEIFYNRCIKNHHRMVFLVGALVFGEIINAIIIIMGYVKNISVLLAFPVVLFSLNGMYQFFYESKDIVRDLKKVLNCEE